MMKVLVGHTFFWHLKAEMHCKEIALRFGLLLEAYLSFSGTQIDELAAQVLRPPLHYLTPFLLEQQKIKKE